jgi:large subunit ribosomal protein L29
MSKYDDVKNLNKVELHKKMRETKQKMFEAKMKNAMGQLTNPISIREMRRDVARLRTALTATTKMDRG